MHVEEPVAVERLSNKTENFASVCVCIYAHIFDCSLMVAITVDVFHISFMQM